MLNHLRKDIRILMDLLAKNKTYPLVSQSKNSCLVCA